MREITPPTEETLEIFRKSFRIFPEEGRIYSQRRGKFGKEIGTRKDDNVQLYYTDEFGRYRFVLKSHLIWWEHYGEWPKYALAHKNGIGHDNSVGNLIPRGSSITSVD